MTDRYWPTLTGEELGDAVLRRFEEFEEAFRVRDLPRMCLATLAYFGEDPDGNNTWTISRAGSREQVRLLVDNEFRTVITNKLTIATSEPGGFLPVPVNTDSDSTATSLQLRGALDYYFDEGKADQTAQLAAEMSETLGWAWVVQSWDPQGGDVAAEFPQTDETGQVIGVQEERTGDAESVALLPSEVAFDYDTRDPNGDRPWLVIRRYSNRWDLAAMVESGVIPCTAEGNDLVTLLDCIRTQTTDRKRDDIAAALRGWEQDATRKKDVDDEIPVYELRHRPTPACRAGRWALVLEGGVVICDGAARYGNRLMAHRIAAGERFGTPRAYTSAHDMLGLQRAVSTLSSIPYSNQAALGLNVIISHESSEMKPEALREGLLHLQYRGDPSMKPESLALVNTPKEIFAFRQEIKADMASKGGMDNLSMGREDRDLSGAAMALLDSRTQRAVSSLAGAHAQLRQDMANSYLQLFKQFGKHSRKIPMLIGKFKRPMTAEISGATFEAFDRVRAERLSPLMRQPSGRLEVAKMLIDAAKVGVQPELVMSVVETGKYESLTEAPMAKRVQLREENELLLAGETLEGPSVATAIFTDNPLEHIAEHRVVLSSLAARRDPNIVANTRAHLEAHMRDLMAWVNGDPLMLALHGPPPPMAPPPTPGALPSPPGDSGNQPPVLPPNQDTPGPSMPTNPATGEKYTPTGDVTNG